MRATQFFLGEVSGTGVHTVYTVPTGKRIVLHGVTVQDVSGAAHVAQLRIGSLGTILAASLAAYPNPGSNVIWNPYIVVTAGDTVQIGLPAGGDVTVTVSGTFLFV